jgi:hypothetical protein
VVATLGMVGMFAASSAASTKQEEALAGVLGSLFVMVPGLIGTAMAFSAYDRRLANPPSVWAALIWNGLILGVFVLLAVVGTFMP